MRTLDKIKENTFIKNLIIGICVVVFIQKVLLPSPFVEGAINYVYDLVILEDAVGYQKQQFQKLKLVGVDGKTLGKVCFIDAEDKNFKEWGYPHQFPRQHLAQYIQEAARNGAKIVVVDVLLEYQSANPSDDAVLLQVLAELTQDKSPLKIIFPVLMDPEGNGPRTSIIDQFVDSNPNFYKAILGNVGSGSDRQVRFIRYFETFMSTDKSLDLLWSIPLLTAVLHADEEVALSRLKTMILDDQTVVGSSPRSKEYRLSVADNNAIRVFSSEQATDRVRYRLIPPGVLGADNHGTLSLDQKIPVSSLMFLGESLRGKIVVIGSSAPHLLDVHATALGQMPGLYVLGNAINTLAEGLQIKGGFFKSLLLEFFLLILFACLLLKCPPVFLELVATLLMFFCVVPILGSLLDSAWFVPVPILLIDIGLFCIVVDFVNESLKLIRRQQ